MTAEHLRRAAARIDELAEKATPGPWEPVENYPAAYVVRAHTLGGFYVATENEEGAVREGDARWIAMLGPQIAGHLAAWFRSQADETAMIDEMNAAASERAKRTGGDGHTFVIQPDRTAHATYLARAILGDDV